MPRVDLQAFAQRVNALRQARELSWKELAAKVGSAAALRNWKRGRSWPRTEAVIELSEVLGVTTDYLLTGRGPIHPQCADPELSALQEEIEKTPRRLREALAYALLGRRGNTPQPRQKRVDEIQEDFDA